MCGPVLYFWAVLCRAELCRPNGLHQYRTVLWCRGTAVYIIPYRTVLNHTVLNHALPYRTIPYRTVLNRVKAHLAIPEYLALHYVLLLCSCNVPGYTGPCPPYRYVAPYRAERYCTVPNRTEPNCARICRTVCHIVQYCAGPICPVSSRNTPKHTVGYRGIPCRTYILENTTQHCCVGRLDKTREISQRTLPHDKNFRIH